MGRSLDAVTLDGAARHYAAAFLRPDRERDGRLIDGPSFVMQELFSFTFKDEFDHILAGVREWMGTRTLAEFDRLAGTVFTPRDEGVLHQLLADKLAVDPDGAHIPGRIGTTHRGSRLVGSHLIEVETPDSIRMRKRLGLPKAAGRATWHKEVPLYWPIYAGETEERLADSGVADALPPGTPGMPVGATNTRISNECALLACDAIVDNLDEGAGAAVIQGRSGAQPADPDTVVSGTLLFTLTCSATAFGSASDAAPGGTATANGITDDSSADATDTLGYCRASSTTDGVNPIDDHIDGEAASPSGGDFNFNTLAIVSGATVSLTSWTVTMPES